MATTVPLSLGHLSWVLGPSADERIWATSVRQSADRLIQIAAVLSGGLAGWTHEGLEFTQLPGGRTSLDGFAENDEVSFLVSVTPGSAHADGTATWDVDAEIAVRCNCDGVADHGMHRAEQRRRGYRGSPQAVVDALDALTAWLHQRCTEVPSATWRERVID